MRAIGRGMSRGLRAGAAVTGVCAAAMALAPTPAHADGAEVACGSIITTDVVLTHNLSCAGDGLVVAAGGVSIDLAGHKLKGASTGTGILVDTGGADVAAVVTNGTVTGFGDDVSVSASSAVFTGVTISRAVERGVMATGPATVAITDSRLTGNATAVFVGRTAGVALRVTNSRLTANGIGVLLNGISNATISGNLFTGNTTAVTAFQSDGHIISENRFSQNVNPINLSQSRNNVIENNRVAGNTNGLQLTGVESQGNAITGNDFVGNDSYGAKLGDGISNLVDTNVAGNTFRANGAAGLWFQGSFVADGSVITGNHFVGNGFAPGALVDENGNALDDGLHVDNPATAGAVTLTDNVASFNAGWGIDASLVIDGGGNRAWGNGQSSGGRGCSARSNLRAAA